GKETAEAREWRIRAEIERTKKTRRRGKGRGRAGARPGHRRPAANDDRRLAEAEYRNVEHEAGRREDAAELRAADADADGDTSAPRTCRRRFSIDRVRRDAADRLRPTHSRQQHRRPEARGRHYNTRLHVTSSTPSASRRVMKAGLSTLDFGVSTEFRADGSGRLPPARPAVLPFRAGPSESRIVNANRSR